MNPIWLFVIVPASAAVGALLMALCVAAGRADRNMEDRCEK